MSFSPPGCNAEAASTGGELTENSEERSEPGFPDDVAQPLTAERCGLFRVHSTSWLAGLRVGRTILVPPRLWDDTNKFRTPAPRSATPDLEVFLLLLREAPDCFLEHPQTVERDCAESQSQQVSIARPHAKLAAAGASNTTALLADSQVHRQLIREASDCFQRSGKGLHLDECLNNKATVPSNPTSASSCRLPRERLCRRPVRLMSFVGDRILFALKLVSLLAAVHLAMIHGAGAEPVASQPKFLGVQSCKSSGCHGGAKDDFNQVIVWERRDYHTRSYATLTTRRSERMAEVLQLGDPTKSLRCTSCHAPFHEVPPALRDTSIRIEQGVSCENCHGPAEDWLRTHTRTDLLHDEKVAAGMRDLRNLYVRANSCVGCHQNVDLELLAAGHPELVFELDGQSATEPRHWRERRTDHGTSAWLVGQAAALREMSWALSTRLGSQQADSLPAVASARAAEADRWSALAWLLQHVDVPGVSKSDLGSTTEPTVSKAQQMQRAADSMARAASAASWPPEKSRALLARLSSTHAEFLDRNTSRSLHARRAERLVLGLDRLVMALPDAEAARFKGELDELFQAVQSIPDFDSVKFASSLQAFATRLSSTRKN